MLCFSSLMSKKSAETVSDGSEMAKNPRRRFPTVRKWQKIRGDGFRRLRNGKKSAETISDGSEMAKNPRRRNLTAQNWQKIRGDEIWRLRIGKKSTETKSDGSELAKNPRRRFPTARKWQNLQRDDFWQLGNGKISRWQQFWSVGLTERWRKGTKNDERTAYHLPKGIKQKKSSR